MEYAKWVFYLVLVGFLWQSVAVGNMLLKGTGNRSDSFTQTDNF